MIRKSGNRLSLATNAKAFTRRSCSNKEMRSTLRRAEHHPGNTELIDAHPETPREKCLAERHVRAAAFRQRLEFALGVRGIVDRQRDRKTLRFVKMIRRRVGGHQGLAVDRNAAVHDLLLALRR